MNIQKKCATCGVVHKPTRTALKRNKNFFCSKECYWKSIRGVKLSPDHCKKISNGQKGRISPMKGKTFKHSEETKIKIGIANKGKVHEVGSKSTNWKGGISKDHRRYNARHRARQANAEGSHTYQEWVDLKEKYNNICLCCYKSESEVTISQDHVQPLSKGGSDYISNIQPLCRSCNSRKHTKNTDYRMTFNITKI